MRFIARVPYLGGEIVVYIPLVPNAIIWCLTIAAHFSKDAWKALALWRYLLYATGLSNTYCD